MVKRNLPKKFFDCCSGMGGSSLGFQLAGMECVGRCEKDKKADAVYETLMGKTIKNYGDISRVIPAELPDFDVLVAGMDGQPFSKIGFGLGECDVRSHLLYSIFNILSVKKPSCCLFEFVDGILADEHEEYRTVFMRMLGVIGYEVKCGVLNTKTFGLPLTKNRFYIIGCRNGFSTGKISIERREIPLESCLCDTDNIILDTTKSGWKEYLSKSNVRGYDVDALRHKDYIIFDRRATDFRIYRDVCPCLRSGNHGLFYTKNGQLRKISAYEAMLLQGMPKCIAEHLKTSAPVSKSKLLSMVGGMMPIPVAYCLANFITKNLMSSATSSVAA